MFQDNPPLLIGQREMISFPEIGVFDLQARIDTGARTSTIWASDIREEDGVLKFRLFDQSSKLYTGEEIIFEDSETRVVTPSNGISEERYMVKILVKLGNKRIRARFTLADRSTQKFPVLIGRNVLRGKFIVDVKLGDVLNITDDSLPNGSVANKDKDTQ